MEKRVKKIVYLFILCFIVTSCNCHRKKTMNHMEFAKIPNGYKFSQITEKFGPPYDVMLLKSGIKEYRYIQINAVAPGVREQVHFIITVSFDGLIINTKVETIMATAELYNPDGPDYLLVEPDSPSPKCLGEKETDCGNLEEWREAPSLFVDPNNQF